MHQLLLALVTLAASGRGREPYIVHQESTMVFHEYASPTWERAIQVRNPRDAAIWLYLECESRLTVNPIGMPGRHTTTITLPDVPPSEGCLINHWYEQRGTEPPKPWSP